MRKTLPPGAPGMKGEMVGSGPHPVVVRGGQVRGLFDDQRHRQSSGVATGTTASRHPTRPNSHLGNCRVPTGDAEAGGVQLLGDDAFPAGQHRVRHEPELPFTDVGAAGVGELVDGHRQRFIHRVEAPGGQFRRR